MKTNKRKYVGLHMRFNHGLLKYEPKLPLRQNEGGVEENVIEAEWWRTLLKLAAIAVAWAGVVLFFCSN